LETNEHDRCGKPAGKPQQAARAAHQFDQAVMYDLYDLLARGNAFEDLLANGPHPDVLYEILDHTKIDISLEKGHADLFQGHLNISLIQTASPPEFLKDAVQFFCKAFKHILSEVT
jgi:hypothetical protein